MPKDINDLCLSYLTKEEQIYYRKEWNKFDKDYVCNIAAENGWLDLLKWARSNQTVSEWDSWTCSYAAENGHLEILKWARENGCEWNSYTCYCS